MSVTLRLDCCASDGSGRKRNMAIFLGDGTLPYQGSLSLSSSPGDQIPKPFREFHSAGARNEVQYDENDKTVGVAAVRGAESQVSNLSWSYADSVRQGVSLIKQ